jgi:hypothetical protein
MRSSVLLARLPSTIFMRRRPDRLTRARRLSIDRKAVREHIAADLTGPSFKAGKASRLTVRRSPNGLATPPGICGPCAERLPEHIRSSTKIITDETKARARKRSCGLTFKTERVFQTLGECDAALAAKHDMGGFDPENGKRT